MPYHIRIASRDPGRRDSDTLALDKDTAWVEQNIVNPRRAGQPIFVSGKVFTWDEIEGIYITWTADPSQQLIPVIRAERRAAHLIMAGRTDEYYVAIRGRDVTENFIAGPPGTDSAHSAPEDTVVAADRKAVMVIYGHDHEANDALFSWLRAIGLQPREWDQLVRGTGEASPYVGEVLEQAFKDAQAVVAYFTPDEFVIARGAALRGKGTWRCQARPNVLIEAGMALVTHPRRTVLVVHGRQDLPSDLEGRNYIRLSRESAQPLNALAVRLQGAGCDVDLSGTGWLDPTRFPDRDDIT